MREIKLGKSGKVTLVDDADFEELSKFKWCIETRRLPTHNLYYARRTAFVNGKPKSILMHREILKPEGKLRVDHIDGDGLNNQRCNLRNATASQNQMNKKPSGKSKFMGVSYSKVAKKWFAAIGQNGSRKYLGYFSDEIEAAKAYNLAALSDPLNLPFRRLNNV